MSTAGFRAYRPSDRPAVLGMLNGSEPWLTLGYPPEFWERYFHPFPAEREGYVLELAGEAAGFALVRPRFLGGDYLELFSVRPASRGSGAGSSLLREVEAVVFGRAKNFFVCVSDFNEGARRFYARHGYREVGGLPDFLVAGRSEILLRKSTGPLR